jgi:hypothetical protein
VVLGGRTYGGEVKADRIGNLRQMSVPREMDAFTEALTRQSKLLALPAGTAQDAIYGAYGNDLELLTRYRNAFKRTIDPALRARAAPDQPDAQAFLDRVIQEVAEIVHEPTLDLGPDTLQLEGNELLGRLQGQVSADVASVKIPGHLMKARIAMSLSVPSLVLIGGLFWARNGGHKRTAHGNKRLVSINKSCAGGINNRVGASRV